MIFQGIRQRTASHKLKDSLVDCRKP